MSNETLGWIALASLLTGGGTGWWMKKATSRFSPRLMRLELARTPADIRKILASWGDSGKKTAKQVLGADFALLAAYGSGFASLVQLAANVTPDWWISKIATPVAWIAIAAAAFDALENTGAWLMINEHLTGWPAVTSYATALKLTGLALVGVWCLGWVMYGEVGLVAGAARWWAEPVTAVWSWAADHARSWI